MQCRCNAMEVGCDSIQFDSLAIAIRCNPIAGQRNYIADQCNAISTRCSPIANRYNGIVIRLYFDATSIASLYQSDVVPLQLIPNHMKSIVIQYNPIVSRLQWKPDLFSIQTLCKSIAILCGSICIRLQPATMLFVVRLQIDGSDAIRYHADAIALHFDCDSTRSYCNSMQ